MTFADLSLCCKELGLVSQCYTAAKLGYLDRRNQNSFLSVPEQAFFWQQLSSHVSGKARDYLYESLNPSHIPHEVFIACPFGAIPGQIGTDGRKCLEPEEYLKTAQKVHALEPNQMLSNAKS